MVDESSHRVVDFLTKYDEGVTYDTVEVSWSGMPSALNLPSVCCYRGECVSDEQTTDT